MLKPVIGYHAYVIRALQPNGSGSLFGRTVSVEVSIRAWCRSVQALLAILGIMPLIRICLEAINGHITSDILKLSAISIPVTVLATVAARRFPPPLPDTAMRRLAFGLLCVLGLSLLVSSL